MFNAQTEKVIEKNTIGPILLTQLSGTFGNGLEIINDQFTDSGDLAVALKKRKYYMYLFNKFHWIVLLGGRTRMWILNNQLKL